MDATIERLRREAERRARGKGPTAIRYPAAFRAAVLAQARPARARGVPVHRIARRLGLSSRCLGRWLARPAAPALRPVTVALAPLPPAAAALPRPVPGPGVVLLTPHGLRVEGLDREALLAILRALG